MAMDYWFPPHRRLAQYLLNWEAARVVGLDKDLRETRPTFVTHLDGGDILADPEGLITAVLNWQGRVSSSISSQSPMSAVDADLPLSLQKDPPLPLP